MKPKIGLLPLYLELYDNVVPEARGRVEEFYLTIAGALEAKGLEVLRTGVCRVKPEFEAAVNSFEDAGADAIVTLHLAYSPSLESAEALAGTKLPVIVLDTAPAAAYGPDTDSAELMFNHGIHGVQDMCNLLIRNGKPFEIEAGHWQTSDVLDRVAAWARAANIASAMRSARIGRIGDAFAGMGDFAVPDEVLAAMGVQTVQCDFPALQTLVPGEADPEVEREIAEDAARFSVEADIESQRRTARTGIAVRRWIEQEKLTGFTMNFGSIDASTGLPTVPFLEASKAMARGLGYAGEGDVLTAALVGALASAYPDTAFVEMFCADWVGESILINHMGEMNVALASGAATLVTKDLPFLSVGAPAVAVGRYRAGGAVLVNLAPGPDQPLVLSSEERAYRRKTSEAPHFDTAADGGLLSASGFRSQTCSFTLIVAPVEMVEPEGEDRMADLIRGWFRPAMPVAEFLESYSHLGGTHHSALVYGDVSDDIARFGELMGWDVAVLG